MERLTNIQGLLIKCMDCEENDNCYDASCSHIDDSLKKLKMYEDTGLTPEQVQDLKERDMSKKPDTRSSCEEHTHFKCPTCGQILMTEYIGYRKIGGMTNFCLNCGQRLDWNEVE